MNDLDPNFPLTITDGLLNTEFSATNLALALGQVGGRIFKKSFQKNFDLVDFLLRALVRIVSSLPGQDHPGKKADQSRCERTDIAHSAG